MLNKKTIIAIVGLLVVNVFFASKASAAVTANCSATKLTIPRCSIKFTQSKTDPTVITTARVGDMRGSWITVADFDPNSHAAYYACENSGSQVLTQLTNTINANEMGGDWTFANVGQERCHLVFFTKGVTPASDWSNAISACETGYVTVTEAGSENVPATGPDCAAKTCKDVACDSQNGSSNPWIIGTKTEGCATVSVTVNPAEVTAPNSVFAKWTSQGAKSMEAECLGPVKINRGGWFLSNAECKSSGLVPECTDKGYELKFADKQTGIETCTFYPTNISNGLPGIPYSVAIKVNDTISNANNPLKSSYICQPDNAGCAANTCHDVYCNDGCNLIKGTNSCLMFPQKKD
ncbi:MAG: hypothetical protein WA064_01115 [Candidatus Moraniibacteriota bacterium]